MHEAEGSSAPGALLHLFEEWKLTGLLATDMYLQNCAPGTNSMSTCGRGRRISVINFFDGGGSFIADLQRVLQNRTVRSLSTPEPQVLQMWPIMGSGL